MIAQFRVAMLVSLLTASVQDQLPLDARATALGNLPRGPEDVAEVPVFTPDGKLEIGCTKTGVIIADAATGKELRRLPVIMPYRACAMAVSPDGTALAVSEYSPQGRKPDQ